MKYSDVLGNSIRASLRTINYSSFRESWRTDAMSTTATTTQLIRNNVSSDINNELNFSKNLQAVTNKIHAASDIDEIMLEVSKDVCALFNADRLTIYTLSEDRSFLTSR